MIYFLFICFSFPEVGLIYTHETKVLIRKNDAKSLAFPIIPIISTRNTAFLRIPVPEARKVPMPEARKVPMTDEARTATSEEGECKDYRDFIHDRVVLPPIHIYDDVNLAALNA